MVGIVNYGMGNLLSVYNALDFIGANVEICHTPKELMNKEKIILPGVGSFKSCMSNLVDKGFYETLDKLVLNEALLMPSLDHSLLNPNQVRHTGLEVQDNPYSMEPIAIISHNNKFCACLESKEATIYIS